MGLLAWDGPERMPQAKCVTGLESDVSPDRSMLGGGSFMGRGLTPQEMGLLSPGHLQREPRHILLKVQFCFVLFSKFHFGLLLCACG